MRTLINIFLQLIPPITFWRRYIQKLLAFTISLKIYMLFTTTYLLLIEKISDSVWSTVFLGIALGRVIEKKIISDNDERTKTMNNNVYFSKKENENEME